MNKIILILTSLFVMSCALNTITKTNKLNPGMSITEFKKVMGEPSSTSMYKGAMVYK